jgi:hypothetical protein
MLLSLLYILALFGGAAMLWIDRLEHSNSRVFAAIALFGLAATEIAAVRWGRFESRMFDKDLRDGRVSPSRLRKLQDEILRLERKVAEYGPQP